MSKLEGIDDAVLAKRRQTLTAEVAQIDAEVAERAKRNRTPITVTLLDISARKLLQLCDLYPTLSLVRAARVNIPTAADMADLGDKIRIELGKQR